jgi:predicted Zn-dependent protease
VIELLLEAERAMEMGRVDAAETLYRQVAGADPRNAMAVVGLARVALEHGDEPEAYRIAQRALAIDPENSAAQRMVTRLAEVLRYRGEPVPDTRVVPDAEPYQAAPQPETASPESPPDTAHRSLIDRLRRGK